MKKILCIGTAIIVTGLLLLRAHSGGSIQTQAAAAVAQGSNVIVRVPSPKEPVRITKLQIRGNDVPFGNSFAGDENWLDALTSEIKNTSGKIITDLRMSVSFDGGGAKARKIHVPLIYAGAILPNQTVQVSAPSTGVGSLRALLAKQGVAANFRRGELQLQLAKFQDGSMWVKGATLDSPDPRTGRRKGK